MPIRTRFAPSPTGYLHIGGVRTALFNWLYARRNAGEFILRIDDTDASRNRADAVKPILDGFDWLGLDWDEGPTKDGSGESTGPHAPYFQGQRNELYVSAAMKLMTEGLAYPDYTPPAKQDADRELAQRLKKPFVYRGSNRDVEPAENLKQYAAKPAPILLKVLDGQTVSFNDHVRGRVDVKTDTIRDPALLRAAGADGVCRALYSFATVVDEAAFGITHVIRAEEHLANTPVQILIFQALGSTVPEFAHIPLVNYNNKKMSKRDLPALTADEIAKLKSCGWTDEELAGRDDLNIATVSYYRSLGYLPEALINYLVRLGWSLDAESEFIPLETILKNFSLERITKAAANFDSKKLFWLQGEYMKLVPPAEKLTRCMPYLRRSGLIASDTISPDTETLLLKIIEAAGERIKLFSDIIAFAAPILNTTVSYDAKAIEKGLKTSGAAELLREFAAVLDTLNPFDAATIDAALHTFATAKGVKPNLVVTPVRVAVTGTQVGFSLFDTLAILGQATTRERIRNTLNTIIPTTREGTP